MTVPDPSAETIHACCVAIGAGGARRGVLLTGRSGAGKSDLALRLIDRGAMLVVDDYTLVRRNGAVLLADPPATIAGQIEVRGLGILAMPHVGAVPVALVIELDRPVPRMPEETALKRRLAGIDLPMIALAPFEASAPIKVEQALIRFGLPA